ncbi:Uncharacterised protein [Mycobacteroides abscessus subsp. abscessus]|nr:Uncharacterised protein [Mycobacteroides abscessus subsp. abscessus]SKV18944.1 Uncharacterised protein [Mycobacteroides abscessus subsp. abscessus]
MASSPCRPTGRYHALPSVLDIISRRGGLVMKSCTMLTSRVSSRIRAARMR